MGPTSVAVAVARQESLGLLQLPEHCGLFAPVQYPSPICARALLTAWTLLHPVPTVLEVVVTVG